MITDPGRWAPGYAEAGAHNVTFHAEATDDPVAVARDIRAAGAKAGLSVKPGTPLEPYLEILRDFDTLLVMSVEPGFGGQSFIPEVLTKVAHRAPVGGLRRADDPGRDRRRHQRRHHRAGRRRPGVDCFVAGSAVYGAADPGAAVEALRRQAGPPRRICCYDRSRAQVAAAMRLAIEQRRNG